MENGDNKTETEKTVALANVSEIASIEQKEESSEKRSSNQHYLTRKELMKTFSRIEMDQRYIALLKKMNIGLNKHVRLIE